MCEKECDVMGVSKDDAPKTEYIPKSPPPASCDFLGKDGPKCGPMQIEMIYAEGCPKCDATMDVLEEEGLIDKLKIELIDATDEKSKAFDYFEKLGVFYQPAFIINGEHAGKIEEASDGRLEIHLEKSKEIYKLG